MNKFVVPILFLSHFCIGQVKLDQSFDFSAVNIPLEEALLQLSEISGTDIAYSNSLLKSQPKVTLRVQSQPLRSILENLLSPANITFKLLGNQVLLFRQKVQYCTLSGYIEDKSSGERLIAATVHSPDLKKGTVANEYGFYSLVLPMGATKIVYSYLGYEQLEVDLDLRTDQQTNIQLDRSITLEEVVVTPSTGNSGGYTSAKDAAAISISREMITLSPDLGGEADPIRVAQLSPGIHAGADGSTGILVRGGNTGQNLMLLDGVPVYIPYHLMGVFSIYNPATVRTVKVYKGSFPARYGGRLSSVFDIRTREGNQQQWSGLVSANLISTKALVEGPLKKDKGAILLSGRHSHSGFLLNPFLQRTYFQNTSEDIETSFYDLNAKINYTLSPKDRIYLSFYQGKDTMEGSSLILEDDEQEENEVQLNWSNAIGALRWNHLFSNNLFSNTTLTFSEHQYEYRVLNQFLVQDEEDPEDLTYLDMYSFNTDLGLQIDFDYSLSPNHQLRFGGGISTKSFLPQLTYFEEEDLDFDEFDDINIQDFDRFRVNNDTEATESNLYLEDQINIGRKLFIDLGMRWSSFSTTEQSFSRIEPRFSSLFRINKTFALRTAFSRMIQYLHLVSFTGVRLPTDLWVPSGKNLAPQESWQGEVGLSLNLRPSTVITFDTYLKQMNNLYTYPEDFEFGEDQLAELLTKGEGLSKGVEINLSHQGAKTGGQIAYAFTDADRKFKELNNGASFAFAQNNPHQVQLFLYHKINAHLSFGLNWVFNSAGPPINIVPLNAVLDQPESEMINNASLSDYHRLDLSATYRFSGKLFAHTLKFGAYNVYNRANTAYFRIDFDREGESFFQPIFGLPFRPSFSYQIQF